VPPERGFSTGIADVLPGTWVPVACADPEVVAPGVDPEHAGNRRSATRTKAIAKIIHFPLFISNSFTIIFSSHIFLSQILKALLSLLIPNELNFAAHLKGLLSCIIIQIISVFSFLNNTP
jgi:hypothetical protein